MILMAMPMLMIVRMRGVRRRNESGDIDSSRTQRDVQATLRSHRHEADGNEAAQ